MRWLLKWFLRLAIAAVVLAVIFLLSLNSLLRVWLEHQIRVRTGMDAEIGRFHLGLTEPTMTILNFRLFNPPDFGGTPFLDVREIHLEYDPAAMAKRRFHVTLLRLDLDELDIVKNQAGRTNLFSIAGSLSVNNSGSRSKVEFKKKTGLQFTGIDVLNVSVGTMKFIDLQDQRRNRSQKIGIDNCVLKDVRSPADLTGLALLVALRGGDFFGSLFGVSKPSLLGH